MSTCYLKFICILLGMAPAEVEESQLQSCAIPALYHFLNHSNISNQITASEVMTAFPPQPKEGYSMDDLVTVAKKFNVELEGYTMRNPPAIISDPIILYTKGTHGHYLALLPVGTSGKNVILIDGYKYPRSMSVTQVIKQYGWSGKYIQNKANSNSVFFIFCLVVSIVCGYIFHSVSRLQQSRQLDVR
jgi:hypothetical protein